LWTTLIAASIVLAGCSTRSISSSGYPTTSHYQPTVGAYRGELAELDVVASTIKEDSYRSLALVLTAGVAE
jgi:sporulation-control protein spo0M